MSNQVLTIEPQELKFKVDSSGLFELNQTTYLQLTNPSEYTVLFTIKTTARTKYLVSPVTGKMSPNSKVDIAIKPQNVHVDLHEGHKFMVRSIIAPEEYINIDRAFKIVPYDQHMDYIIKCVFKSAQVANFNNSDENSIQSEITEKSVPVTMARDIEPLTKDAVEDFIQNEAKGEDERGEEEDMEEDPEDTEEGSEDEEEGSEAETESSIESENVSVDLLGSDLQKIANEIIHLKEKDSRLSNETVGLEDGFLMHQEGELFMPPGIENEPHNSQVAPRWAIFMIFGMSLLGSCIGMFLNWILPTRW